MEPSDACSLFRFLAAFCCGSGLGTPGLYLTHPWEFSEDLPLRLYLQYPWSGSSWKLTDDSVAALAVAADPLPSIWLLPRMFTLDLAADSPFPHDG